MPTLADALVAKAKADIGTLEGGGGPLTRAAVKKAPLDAATLHPDNLRMVSIGATYTREFADIIGHGDHSFKLLPFVTVTAASMGVGAIWMQVLWTWANTPPPSGGAIDPDVKRQIETLIPNYVALIAREKSPPPGP